MEITKCIYSHNMWSVIERKTVEWTRYSVVRFGSAFYEHTFRTLTEAIDFCDSNN